MIVQIEISNFNEDAGVIFDALVKEAIAKNPKGVIIDLRNNPGGYLIMPLIFLVHGFRAEVVLQRRQGRSSSASRPKETANSRTFRHCFDQ